MFQRTLIALLLGTALFAADHSYLGFDRNEYPGDENLAALHETFSFTGYWLNSPPRTNQNTWQGKREKLKSTGFGFLVLFNGRLYRELKSETHAKQLGLSDAQSAASAATREGFPPRTIIFLDIEEGGRMLPEQNAYIFSWMDELAKHKFRIGVYCSGMAATAANLERIVTANDIHQHAAGRQIAYWVTNDACPPSPGCETRTPPPPATSGIDFAEVWQFAQSPKRKDVASGCPANYHADGNCYAPRTRVPHSLMIDLNSAGSPDPSYGR